MKKKVRLAVVLVFALLFLVGWGKQSVKLLNNTKLIDLEAALQVCLHGEGMSEGDENLDNPDEPVSTQSPDTPTDPKEDIDEEKIIIISVRGRGITYDTIGEVRLEELEEQIRQGYRDRNTYRLVDDFAEAHVYRRIRTILAGLKEEIGLEYTEERGE